MGEGPFRQFQEGAVAAAFLAGMVVRYLIRAVRLAQGTPMAAFEREDSL